MITTIKNTVSRNYSNLTPYTTHELALPVDKFLRGLISLQLSGDCRIDRSQTLQTCNLITCALESWRSPLYTVFLKLRIKSKVILKSVPLSSSKTLLFNLTKT